MIYCIISKTWTHICVFPMTKANISLSPNLNQVPVYCKIASYAIKIMNKMLYNKKIAWIISELDKIFQLNWVVEKFAVSIEFVVRPDKSMGWHYRNMSKSGTKAKAKGLFNSRYSGVGQKLDKFSRGIRYKSNPMPRTASMVMKRMLLIAFYSFGKIKF